MTDLADLLTSVRTHYVDMFEAALAELREKGHTIIIEPPMVDAQGALAREGELNLGARYDLATVEGEGAKPSMFSPSRMLDFEPEAFHGAGLDIHRRESAGEAEADMGVGGGPLQGRGRWNTPSRAMLAMVSSDRAMLAASDRMVAPIATGASSSSENGLIRPPVR